MAKYKLLRRWYVSDCFGEDVDEGWEVVGVFSRIRKARQAMHKDVREVEIANCYQDDGYGGLDDVQQSIRLGRDRHVYDMADMNGSHVEWEIVGIGKGFTKMIGDY